MTVKEHWYILHTKPGQERPVAVQLFQRGLDVYLPLIWVDPANPRAPRQRPYFPGYLFARLGAQADGISLVRWSSGLHGVVENCGEPVTVGDRFIDELRRRLEEVRSVDGMRFGPAHAPPPPTITDGPFAGFEGIFNPRLRGPDRSHVLLACAQLEHLRQSLPQATGDRPTDGELGARPVD